jgi:RNA polymerase sigma-70 factor, ECF subfamily
VDARSLFLRRFLDLDPGSVASAAPGKGECVNAPGLAGGMDGLAAEEIALISRAKAGDQEAFATLVQRYQRQVYNLALRMLRDTDEASEATQEAFLAAWQHLRGFRQDARFATWLYRITYHHCLKVSESRRRDSVARSELSATTARMHSPEGRMSIESALIAERELRETVRDEIAHLPPKYRAVLVLRHLQELSYEEISDVMRVPIGTVKTQLFRARALLKERLEDLDRARTEGIARAGELRAELEAGLRTMLERHMDYARKGDGQ